MDEIIPHKVIDCLRKLPSDSVFRLDLICRILQDKKEGQKHKEGIENLQRHDQKLRKK